MSEMPEPLPPMIDVRRIVASRGVRIGAALVVVLGLAAGGYLYLRDDGAAQPPVPTFVGPAAANAACLDTTTDDTGTADEWYPADAVGTLTITGDIVASAELGSFTKVATDAFVAEFGSFASSAVREMAPSTTSCGTLRLTAFTLADGSEVHVMMWRLVAAATPAGLPQEAPFTTVDDRTLVSSGEHVVTVLSIAPDGTTVMVAGYGAGARVALTSDDPPADAVLGAAPATVDQLRALAETVMAAVHPA
ncbi:MAG: hypothetical protein ABMA25_22090 [Ilumatobacteraceae bacterium]